MLLSQQFLPCTNHSYRRCSRSFDHCIGISLARESSCNHDANRKTSSASLPCARMQPSVVRERPQRNRTSKSHRTFTSFCFNTTITRDNISRFETPRCNGNILQQSTYTILHYNIKYRYHLISR